jgi:DnaJ-class molecular chaperone
VPHLRRPGSRGDLHVIVDVAVPTKLSRAEREALQAYAAAADEPVSDGATLLGRVRDKLA